jgi:hypothetical protein
MRRPTLNAGPLEGLHLFDGLLRPNMEGGSALEMDASKEHPRMTAGLELAEKYSYPSASSTKRMARWWRKVSALRTTPEALRRRFACEHSLPIATTGRNPLALGVSRVLEECGHQVCWWPMCSQTEAHLYTNKPKTDEIDASRESGSPATP